jgi:predicted alpha/beta-fold hydrolase
MEDQQPTNERRAIKHLDGVPPFRPHRWCTGGRLHAISIKWLRTGLNLDDRSDVEIISVADDHTPPDRSSGFYVPAVETSEPKPLVVVFHGMGGDATSQYMRLMTQRLNEAGYSALLWNHRGAGRSSATCSHLHHPGFTDDVQWLTRYLNEERPGWSKNGLVCVAFSLAADLLLKYLAETGVESAFDVGISVSAPIDMKITSKKLQTGADRVFDRYLLRSQREELLRDNAELSVQERQAVQSARSVWELDDTFTGPRLGYAGAS